MKCPKCGYNSFEHLNECKKCGQDLADHKAKFNLRGFYAAGQAAPVMASEDPTYQVPVDENPEIDEAPGDESVDFGFDFLDEEEDQIDAAQDSVTLGDDTQDVSIDQPFGADSETIPADDLAANDGDDDKPEKGPEFAF